MADGDTPSPGFYWAMGNDFGDQRPAPWSWDGTNWWRIGSDKAYGVDDVKVLQAISPPW